MQPYTRRSKATIAEKFRFMDLAFGTFESDLQDFLAENEDTVSHKGSPHDTTDHTSQSPCSVTASNKLPKLRQALVVLEFCMEVCQSELQESQKMEGMAASLYGRLLIIGKKSATIHDDSISLLVSENGDGSDPTKNPLLLEDHSVLRSQLEIFGFCFDKIQSDYSEHAESAPQDSVPQNSVPQETFQELPQAGSTYIIRSIKNGATVCGGQHDVQTVHRDKHANATPKYHWTVIDQDGWLFLKNVEHGYYLGYTRTGSTRLIEAKSQKLMSEQCQITMRFETGGGITLWGHMNNKMGKILLRDVQTRYTNFKDAFKFVQVR